MRGQAIMDWAATNGINLKLKAPRQKAWIVERHNEILRRDLHGTEAQLLSEGIRVPFEQILAIVTFMRIALLVINGPTPYQGVFGRQTPILPPLEGGLLSHTADHARPETNARHEARIREVASIKIIESNAAGLVARADHSKTRGCIEIQGYTSGDQVDLWFEPKNKDQSGWRGPGQIATINADEGNISIRHQGRTLDRRNQEVRPHIPFLVFASMTMPDAFGAWLVLKRACQELRLGSVRSLGLVWQDGVNAGWYLSPQSPSARGRDLMQTALKQWPMQPFT